MLEIDNRKLRKKHRFIQIPENKEVLFDKLVVNCYIFGVLFISMGLSFVMNTQNQEIQRFFHRTMNNKSINESEK